MIRYDELHPREPDAIDRKPGGLEGQIGVAEVDHDARAGSRQPAEVDALHLKRHRAGVDFARVALRAGHGHRLPVGHVPVACSAPTTAGIPSSRATMAAWQVRPPRLVTMAAAVFITGSQSGVVVSATSTSPGRKDES